MKLDFAILQTLSAGKDPASVNRLEPAIESLQRKHKEFVNIIELQAEAISELKQENLLFISKLASLESILSTLDSHVSVCDISNNSGDEGNNFSMMVPANLNKEPSLSPLLNNTHGKAIKDYSLKYV